MVAVTIITGICMVSVYISYVAFRKGFTKSADDYFVAGSSLGYFVLIFSLLASFLSAFTIFGMSSFGYRLGFGSLYVLTANLVPLGFLWYYMHKKTFLLGRSRKWMSMGSPFGERYGSATKITVVLTILMASIPFLVAQIQGIGVILEAMSEGKISYHVGLFFVPFFIACYLMMGGMKGAAWVNAIQGVFFSIMVFILFFFVMMKNGGFVPTMEMVMGKHPQLFQIGWAGGKVWSYPMIFGMASAMCLGCVCFPQPYMHAYASRSAKGLKAMFLSFGGISLVVITMPTLIGIAGKTIVPGLEGVEADKIYGLVASATMPDWLAALAVSGGFTAAMSTVNGIVFGNATNIAIDIVKTMRPKTNSSELIAIARVSVAIIMAICVYIAWNPNTPVAELSIIAFGTGAVTFFALWGAYYWKRATKTGAILSTLVGATMNVTFFLVGGKAMVLFPQKFLFQLNGFLASFIVSGIVFFVGSYLTSLSKIEEESLKLFFHPALSTNKGEIQIEPMPTLSANHSK
ncbi:sodium:solute symporter family protein [Desulfobacula phenolica]|uniref:Solute:Na+ symporter, SSS family n=1 Tax=Desulfobacula phenolica TaxID=90732 RepID=A0A1H2IUK8_9BACT|nr:sodium:solute symporter family protein [Desulfobacula phenolica]SDU47849.1 solute:Na+ symporter, SSS family [Desulfobacula phenolica]